MWACILEGSRPDHVKDESKQIAVGGNRDGNPMQSWMQNQHVGKYLGFPEGAFNAADALTGVLADTSERLAYRSGEGFTRYLTKGQVSEQCRGELS